MNGSPTGAQREGPARARALARQRAAERPESATAWLKGSHEAIALHPQWQKAGQVCACFVYTCVVYGQQSNDVLCAHLYSTCVLRLTTPAGIPRGQTAFCRGQRRVAGLAI